MGTGIEVIDQRPAILGSKKVDGSRVPDTLLEVDISTNTPSFSKPPLEPGGTIGCFAIRTKTNFTSDDATHRKFVVGLGFTLRERVGPHAIFVPEPGELYHIRPSTSFYVVIGEFEQGDILTPEALKSSPGFSKIDFVNRPGNGVIIIHEGHRLIVLAD